MSVWQTAKCPPQYRFFRMNEILAGHVSKFWPIKCKRKFCEASEESPLNGEGHLPPLSLLAGWNTVLMYGDAAAVLDHEVPRKLMCQGQQESNRTRMP